MVTMIDGLGLAATASTSLVSPSPSAVSATDVERFQNAMATEPTVTAVAVNAAFEPSQVNRTGSLGDVILNTLESSSSQIRSAWTEAGQTFNRSEVLMSDMLRLQMTVLEASIQYDLISKGISKANQSLDQLLRTQ